MQRVCDVAVCIGGGPSLTREQCEVVRQWRAQGTNRLVIGVNDAYLIASFIDVCFFPDKRWYGWHCDRPEFLSFAGQKCSLDHRGRVEDEAVYLLRYDPMLAFSDDPGMLAGGAHGNGGLQIINIEVLAGAKTILLIGYDARGTHWFGLHPEESPESVNQKYRLSFSAAESELKKRGVRVINCSPGTAVESFETMPLEDALRALPAA